MKPSPSPRSALHVKRWFQREGAGLGFTLLFVVVAWGAIWHVFTPADFTRPTEYTWDSMFSLGVAKSYGDRGLAALTGAPTPWLGAPTPARWNDFPVEDLLFLGVGWLGRGLGIVTAMNLAFLGSVLLAAAAMFWAARRLRVAPPLAMLAAVLFSLSPFLHYRNINHFSLIVYWPLPLAILVWLWTSSKRGLRWGEPRFWGACAVACVMATLNSYYTNFLMQVLLLIGVVALLRRQWRSALATFSVMAAGMAVFVLVNLDTLTFVAHEGRNTQAVSRQPGETLTYGLRPLELLVPSNTHRVDWMAQLGAAYQRSAPVLGEFPSNFLGVLPLLAFIAMVLAGLAAMMGAARRGAHSRFLAFTFWLTFVAMGGGLMMLAQMVTGFVAFRSNNRVSILILALAVMFGGHALTPAWRRLARRRGVLWSWVPAVALAIFGAWEQSPALEKRTVYLGGRNHWQIREHWRAAALSDEKFTHQLESSLPAGAGVFQLPPVPFPEAGSIRGIADYEPFRIYLNSSRKLRFSYGSMKGRPEAEWQFQTAQLPPGAMLDRLQASGFGAVVFMTPVVSASSIEAFETAAAQRGPSRVFRSELGDWEAVVFGTAP